MNSPQITIAVAQINCVVGDLAGNTAKIASFARQALQGGAHLLITPELSLCGYPPEDLLLQSNFIAACARQLSRLAELCTGMDVLVGHPWVEDGACYNAVSLLREGNIYQTYRKRRLPHKEVFDEYRYFVPGQDACVVTVRGVGVGLVICADVWRSEICQAAYQAGAELLCVLNASPYHIGKQALRHAVVQERVRETHMAVLYCNLLGGQDELVFDGGSFAMGAEGELAYQAERFKESLDFIEYAEGCFQAPVFSAPPSVEAEIYEALKLGLKDYVSKNHYHGVVIDTSTSSLEGALCMGLAVEALGAQRVWVRGQSEGVAKLARWWGVELSSGFISGHDILRIEPIHKSAVACERRIQACTPDGLALLKDVLHGTVCRLWALQHADSGMADLFQYSDSALVDCGGRMLSAACLDGIIEAYVERGESLAEIASQGYEMDVLRHVVAQLHANERWRKHIPTGIRVTTRGFGKDWRYPITNHYADMS